ncbi:MAG TPA: hypothetical protein VLX92_12950 [Kofleriaceae bacterium]|nr:hypothetical protein [Kofleriaceae bacterium]
MRTGLALLLFTIACGTEPPMMSGPPFQPDSPQVYVAKVKQILVGLPPTDDEIAQVTADPNALGSLVDSWMQLPQYNDKMKVFFELAFQQTQITAADFVDNIPTNGLGPGKQVNLLVQNARESFARTVLELNAEGKPLTDAFTTHQVMMTPALMELYAFMDARPVDDTATITDQLAVNNPSLSITLEYSQGPIPLSDSLDPTNKNGHYMVFYSPDLPGLKGFPNSACDAEDPITIAVTNPKKPGNANLSYSLHDILYGAIPQHQTNTTPAQGCGERAGSGMGALMQPSDFTSWKMINIRQPNAGEQTTLAYDIISLRSANELVLHTPHPGFFSTPAFQANWPTNTSNQFRVTANQALIVATGAQVDGSDQTVPPSTPGLDTEHAAPNTLCYSCHQLLDPTRSILSSTYSYFYYPQTDQSLINQPGLFAFQGVIAQVHTIDDFANTLATHPLVPQAWAQKLCYYVNSAPCDTTDPEFKRILGDFSGGGMQWNALVKDIVTSPITTNAAATKTNTTNGEVIAVSRRDHMCAALNNRLDLVDICQLDLTVSGNQKTSTVAQIISGMPSDGYGRGATVPVLPNQPTLFYRAGLENLCEAISAEVIDAAPDPNQPSAIQWKSSDPNGAIKDFVSTMMGLTTNDPRTAPSIQALTDHYNAALAISGTSPTDALRSTFVVACLSPTFIGIGM